LRICPVTKKIIVAFHALSVEYDINCTQLSSPCYWISQHYNHFSPRDNCKHSRNDNITNHKIVDDDHDDDGDHDENDGDDNDDDCSS